MKNKINLLSAGALTLIILITICVKREFYPFGDQCMLHIDMYHQYCPFFSELMDKLKSGESLFYSWNIGLGSDFLSLYAYYLASPLNWLLVLCPKAYIIEAMTIFVIVKLTLCSVTFAYYLEQHFDTSHAATVVFGAAYALSGFTAAYAWNIMWLDVVMLAPLVILGLERLLKGGKPALYYLTLSAAILCNFYMALILCVFLVFWFMICAAENISRSRAGLKVMCLRFAVYSLLAGGTGAVLVIPTAIVLGASGASGASFPDTMTWYFNLLSELSRANLTAEEYTGGSHWPNLYCGVFVIVLSALYVVMSLSSRTEKRRRFPYTALLIFMLISFANNILDYIWHGFRFPTSLPGRQSFLCIFLVLVISYDVIVNIDLVKIWQVVLSGGISGILLFGAYKYADFSVSGESSFTMTAIWMAVYTVLLAMAVLGNKAIRNYMFAIAAFAVCAELIFNYQMTALDGTSRSSYAAEWEDYESVLATAEELSEGTFYRTEKLERKTKNDAAMLGYRSATQFSTLMNLDVSHLYQKVGMEGGKNFYSYNGATPLLSAMLSVKYILADNALEAGPLMKLADSSGDVYLYENNYVLPLGFMMDAEAAEKWSGAVTEDTSSSGVMDMGDGTTVNIGSDIERQNALAFLLGAKGEMLYRIDSSSSVGETVIEADETGYYYAVYETTDIDNIYMSVTAPTGNYDTTLLSGNTGTASLTGDSGAAGRTRNYTKTAHNYTLDLGYCTAGSEIKITNTEGKRLSVTAYRLSLNAFLSAFTALNAQTMEVTSFSDTGLTGEISVETPGALILSVANEDGWSVSVDGETVTPQDFGGAFISIPLSAGDHVIELNYTSPGFALGALISLMCIIVYARIRKKA